jgi:hypothetical protein
MTDSTPKEIARIPEDLTSGDLVLLIDMNKDSFPMYYVMPCGSSACFVNEFSAEMRPRYLFNNHNLNINLDTGLVTKVCHGGVIGDQRYDFNTPITHYRVLLKEKDNK